MQTQPPQQHIIGGQMNSAGTATPFGNPQVMMGPPSQAAKVIGILIMVMGGFFVFWGLIPLGFIIIILSIQLGFIS